MRGTRTADASPDFHLPAEPSLHVRRRYFSLSAPLSPPNSPPSSRVPESVIFRCHDPTLCGCLRDTRRYYASLIGVRPRRSPSPCMLNQAAFGEDLAVEVTAAGQPNHIRRDRGIAV